MDRLFNEAERVPTPPLMSMVILTPTLPISTLSIFPIRAYGSLESPIAANVAAAPCRPLLRERIEYDLPEYGKLCP